MTWFLFIGDWKASVVLEDATVIRTAATELFIVNNNYAYSFMLLSTIYSGLTILDNNML